MRIWVDPDKLAKLNITVPEIVNAINAQNTVNPAGQISAEPIPKGQDFTNTVRAQGRLVTQEDFEEIASRANVNGTLVRVKVVARVQLGAHTYSMTRRGTAKQSAFLPLYPIPASHAVQSTERVRT